MIIVKLPAGKLLNHDQLVAELGYPVALRLGAGDLCEAIQVEDAHEAGVSPAAILAAVASHVAGPPAVPPLSKEQLLEARVLTLETKTKALEEK